MSSVITETAGDADFGTGLTLPDNGDQPEIWSVVIEAALQQLADRSQSLRTWNPDAPTIRVPLVAVDNLGSRFTGTAANNWYYSQSSIASAGGLTFTIPELPVGRMITSCIAYWVGAPGHGALPATMPLLSLYAQTITVGGSFSGSGTLIGTQTDAAASVGAYEAIHAITIASLTEVISANKDYSLLFKGEASTNAATLGVLCGLRLTLAA